jgi:hypothetical protein
VARHRARGARRSRQQVDALATDVIRDEFEQVLERGKPIPQRLPTPRPARAAARAADGRAGIGRDALSRRSRRHAARPTRRASRLAPYVFIAPFFILFAVFGLFPLLFSIWLSLHQWDPAAGLQAMRWVGFENYAFTLTDPWFHRSLYNTLWFAIVSGCRSIWWRCRSPTSSTGACGAGRNVGVGAYFVPYITSSVAIALIFTTLFSKDYGVVNALLPGSRLPGLVPCMPARVDWLGERTSRSRRSRSWCSGVSSAGTWCCTSPRCRRSTRTCTTPPRSMAPALAASSPT